MPASPNPATSDETPMTPSTHFFSPRYGLRLRHVLAVLGDVDSASGGLGRFIDPDRRGRRPTAAPTPATITPTQLYLEEIALRARGGSERSTALLAGTTTRRRALPRHVSRSTGNLAAL